MSFSFIALRGAHSTYTFLTKLFLLKTNLTHNIWTEIWDRKTWKQKSSRILKFTSFLLISSVVSENNSSRVGYHTTKSLDFPPLSINIGMTILNLYYLKSNWALSPNSNFLISISLQSQGDCEPKCATQDHVFLSIL